jgi:hypothetical protein
MTWTDCPVCSEPTRSLRYESVVLNGVAHTIPSIWLVGATTARERRTPRASALEHYRDAIEAWAEQCAARGQQ